MFPAPQIRDSMEKQITNYTFGFPLEICEKHYTFGLATEGTHTFAEPAFFFFL